MGYIDHSFSNENSFPRINIELFYSRCICKYSYLVFLYSFIINTIQAIETTQ